MTAKELAIEAFETCEHAGMNAVALRGTSAGRRPGTSVGGGAEQPHIFCLARTHAAPPRDFRRHRTSPCDNSPHRRDLSFHA